MGLAACTLAQPKSLPPQAEAAELADRVFEILNQDPELAADDAINVTPADGAIELSGIVTSWHEHRQATRDAFAAGAQEVFNSIRVRNSPMISRSFVYTHPPTG